MENFTTKSGVEVIYTKIIESGSIVEVMRYSKPILRGYKRGEIKRIVGVSSDKDRAVSESQRRAKGKLERIINVNYGRNKETTKFLTLTYANCITDIKESNKDFKLFIKRLNWRLWGSKAGKLQYTCVMELQKRGAVHYHVILYNMPYTPIRQIQEIWGHGIVHIEKIENISNVGKYMTKYLTKFTPIGSKSYYNSRNLLSPTEITDKEKIASYVEDNGDRFKFSFGYDYTNDYTGYSEYSQYILRQDE